MHLYIIEFVQTVLNAAFYCFGCFLCLSFCAQYHFVLFTATKDLIELKKKQSFLISYIKIYIWLHHKQTINSFCSTSFFSFRFIYFFTQNNSQEYQRSMLGFTYVKVGRRVKFFHFFLFFFENRLFYKKCAGYHGGTAVVRTQRLPMRITTYSNLTANKTLQICTRGHF